MTNQQHNKYLGISFLVHAGFQLFWMLAMTLMMYFFFTNMPSRPGEPGPPLQLFAIFFVFMIVFQMIFTVPSLVAGYAILKQKSWARLAGIIGGVVAAMSFPIGTAVCVYAMWFLLGEAWKSVYSQSTPQPERSRAELHGGDDTPMWAHQSRKPEEEKVKWNNPPDWR